MDAKQKSDMSEQRAKVLFELDPDYWPGPGGETLWAEPIAGSEWRHFRLMNTPFHVRGALCRPRDLRQHVGRLRWSLYLGRSNI